MKNNAYTRAICAAACALALASQAVPIRAQDSSRMPMMNAAAPADPTDSGSLFNSTYAPPPPKTLEQTTTPASVSAFGSLYAVPSPQTRRFKKHDLLTVIINENSDTSTTATNNSKKQQDFDLALQQFLALNVASSGIPYVTKVGNPSNLPEVKFKYNNDTKANADQTREDKFSARLTAEVIDIKPNGTLVVQAVKTIKQDKEIQEFRLSGVCRSEDVTIDNTIISTQLADLRLEKVTSGEVRNGTKRGWLNNLLDQFNPF
jgi:flagellar L-ring protein precursor FlgH